MSGQCSASITSLSERIVSTPDTCGGEPRIAGTRVLVRVLATYRQHGSSDDELLRDFPFLRSEDLAAAWAFVAIHPGVMSE
jgi:uncharacterized protein (DUF433 family)